MGRKFPSSERGMLRLIATSLPGQRVLVAQLTFRLPPLSQSPFASCWTSHIPDIAKVLVGRSQWLLSVLLVLPPPTA